MKRFFVGMALLVGGLGACGTHSHLNQSDPTSPSNLEKAETRKEEYFPDAQGKTAYFFWSPCTARMSPDELPTEGTVQDPGYVWACIQGKLKKSNIASSGPTSGSADPQIESLGQGFYAYRDAQGQPTCTAPN